MGSGLAAATGNAAALAETFTAPADEPLTDAWQRLFIGPYALPAPPWGSVWLDRESVLFGDSTLALRQWMRENGIAFEMQQNEPEDHFGTLLLLAAWLAENGREASAIGFWRGTFCHEPFPLGVCRQRRASVLYRAGQLAQLTLRTGVPRCLFRLRKRRCIAKGTACSRLAGKPGFGYTSPPDSPHSLCFE
jgi:TorA maturation chaperone TorD